MSRTFATATFTADGNASPLVYAFQVARLAVVAEVAARIGGNKITLARPAPGLLLVTAHQDEMAAIVAELEKAQVLSPLLLDVSATEDVAAEDYAEFIRDRTDNVVVVARPAEAGPAS